MPGHKWIYCVCKNKNLKVNPDLDGKPVLDLVDSLAVAFWTICRAEADEKGIAVV